MIPLCLALTGYHGHFAEGEDTQRAMAEQVAVALFPLSELVQTDDGSLAVLDSMSAREEASQSNHETSPSLVPVI